jgi:hypothetical protein
MPWAASEAPRFTKKARSAKKKRQWSHVSNSMLERGSSEASAIKAANAAVAGTARPGRRRRRRSRRR